MAMSENSNHNSGINAAATSHVQYVTLEVDIKQYAPKVYKRMYSGGRGIRRNDVQAQDLFEKIPASHRAGTDGKSAVAKVQEYLHGKDASHIIPHSKGGSSDPSNLKWEDHTPNQKRHGKIMTSKEQRALDAKATSDNLSGAFKMGMDAGVRGAVIGAFTALPFSFLRNTLRVSRGEITSDEAVLEILKDTGIGSGVGGVTAFSVTYLASSFPPVAIALSAISPALWVAGGVGMISELVGILEHNKHQVRAYYDNLTIQQLENLRREEEHLNYEHNESIRSSQNLVKRITDRPHKSGVQASLERLQETLEIARSLGVTGKDSELFANVENRYLLSGD
jgi:hypothetical protein